jgi:hypothetical protein
MSDLIGKIDSPASITGVIAPELNIIGVIANGIKGDKGDPGIDGIQGFTGAAGTTGSTGLTGDTGLPGIPGIDGTPGIDGLPGIQGDAGATGATGLQGTQGIQGTKGDPGADGYTPVKNIDYFDGATGLQGIPGIDGIIGVDGATGAQGVIGDTGVQGITGDTGIQGIQGEVGPKGDIDPTLANQIITLEGTGWVNETVKGNATALTTHQADYVRNPGYAVDTGVANAYVVTFNPAPTAYADGMLINIKIMHTNTGSATINVNELGAKNIYKANGGLLRASDLTVNSIYELVYTSGGYFYLIGGDTDAVKLGGVVASDYVTAAQGTWEKISSITLAATTGQVDFTSIPSGYKEFRLSVVASADAASTLMINFNDDVALNYYSGTSTAYTFSAAMPLATVVEYGTFSMTNGLGANKIILGQSGTGKAALATSCCTWQNAQEISKISLIAQNSKIMQIGSKFVLWGCK